MHSNTYMMWLVYDAPEPPLVVAPVSRPIRIPGGFRSVPRSTLAKRPCKNAGAGPFEPSSIENNYESAAATSLTRHRGRCAR
jgi:hypothetical protein